MGSWASMEVSRLAPENRKSNIKTLLAAGLMERNHPREKDRETAKREPIKEMKAHHET